MHKGVLRYKHRYPRKLKKKKKKANELERNRYKKMLISIYGERDWSDHIIYGG